MRRRLFGSSSIKGRTVQQIETQAGDVVFYDSGSNSVVYFRINDGEEPILETYTPFGVVVVPANHNVYGDYAVGVMSLEWMSTSNPNEGNADASASDVLI